MGKTGYSENRDIANEEERILWGKKHWAETTCWRNGEFNIKVVSSWKVGIIHHRNVGQHSEERPHRKSNRSLSNALGFRQFPLERFRRLITKPTLIHFLSTSLVWDTETYLLYRASYIWSLFFHFAQHSYMRSIERSDVLRVWRDTAQHEGMTKEKAENAPRYHPREPSRSRWRVQRERYWYHHDAHKVDDRERSYLQRELLTGYSEIGSGTRTSNTCIWVVKKDAYRP